MHNARFVKKVANELCCTLQCSQRVNLKVKVKTFQIQKMKENLIKYKIMRYCDITSDAKS